MRSTANKQVPATRATCHPPRAAATALAAFLLFPAPASAQGSSGPEARFPFPQHVAYAAGTLLPDHASQAQLDDDVRRFYDYWKLQYLVADGNARSGAPLYRVAVGRPGSPERATTVSEGQGYGMLIVVLMAGHDPDARRLFDGSWLFSREHPSDIDRRLMGWQVPPDPQGNDSAFDGDADIALALLLAHRQWGSDDAIDYSSEAAQVLDAIYESTIGPRSRLPMLGDWVNPRGARYNQYTYRTSDLMLGSFRTFWRVTGEPRWQRVVRRSVRALRVLQRRFSRRAGLLPDFVEPVSGSNRNPRPADAAFLEGPNDGDYSWNACRVPLRIGLDAVFHRNSGTLLAQLSAWAESAHAGSARELGSGYDLDGSALPGATSFATAYAAPLGVAAMTRSGQQAWLNDIYRAIVNEHQDYYGDTLNLISLLVITGNLWDQSRQ